MYLKRKADAYLNAWKSDPNRSPLIIKGPRQVGKTETIHLAHGDFAIAIHIKPWSPQTAIIRKTDYRQAFSGIHMLHD